jgi:hypothetical protein
VKVALLVGVTAAVWAAAAVAAAGLDGPGHLLPSVTALGLCLVPAVGTLVAVRATADRSPVEAIGTVLVAPLVRLLVVSLGGVVLWQAVPAFRDGPVRFWGWVLGLYLFTLVAETAVLLSRPGDGRKAPSGA